MAESDYIWVSTPHDPLSISGSDPHAVLTTGGTICGNARLAAWYNCDVGNYITGALRDGDFGHKLSTLKDISGNSKSEYQSNNKMGSGTHRHLNSGNYYRPILSGNLDGLNVRITGHRQQFAMGSYSLSDEEGSTNLRNMFLCNKEIGRSATNDTTSLTWISGSVGNLDGYADETLRGGYSLYTTMKFSSKLDDMTKPLVGVTYPSAKETNGARTTEGNFSLLLKHSGSGKFLKRTAQIEWQTGGTGTPYLESYGNLPDGNLTDDWHILSGIYDNQADESKWKCSLYVAGREAAVAEDDVDAGPYPQQHNNKKRISIGGGAGTYGGGEIGDNNVKDYINGVHETFVFDDALSQIRNAQMSAYLCDRLERPLSSSFYHGQFTGQGKGQPFTHDILSNALTGQGTYCRVYMQQPTSSTEGLIQHETAAGSFAKGTLDSSAYYRPVSSKALSLRLWVRAESLNDTEHTGSCVALVAKATSPWGNKMDNIKGYALKFGTMVNGLDTGDLPKFVLSMRDSYKWNDGKTTSDCTDVVVGNTADGTPADIRTPSVDKWYRIRLDVIPFGHLYDQIKAYASVNGTTWFQLGSTQTIYRDSDRYRHWCDDAKKPVDANDFNGIYNGYYLTMSSSTGHTLDTKYYVGKFEINTDTV